MRQPQERTDVIPPILASAFHQSPDRLANLSDVIETINRIGLQHILPKGFESLVLQLDEKTSELDLDLLAR